jgi:hypothetical protein
MAQARMQDDTCRHAVQVEWTVRGIALRTLIDGPGRARTVRRNACSLQI